MIAREPNDPGETRSYLAAFERRFVRTRDGIVYLPGETGAGIRVPADDAAAIIAAARRAMTEADGRAPFGGAQAATGMISIGCMILIAGALTGYMQFAAAAIVPLAIGLIVLGPLLGSLHREVTFKRIVADAEARMATFERIDTLATRRLVRPNPVRPIYYVAATLFGAVVVGLTIAAATSPRYVGASIEATFASWLGWVAGGLILLAFGYKAADAILRPRVSDFDIDLAERLERRRRLAGDD